MELGFRFIFCRTRKDVGISLLKTEALRWEAKPLVHSSNQTLPVTELSLSDGFIHSTLNELLNR